MMRKGKNSQSQSAPTGILIIHCPDRQGIVAIVTEFIYKNKGNITYLEQHVDTQKKTFFMRLEWHLDGFIIPREKIGEYFDTLIAQRFGMKWKLYFPEDIPRMAVFVSKLPHCLFDIIGRWQSGELKIQIPLIISNHPDLKPIVEKFGIDFHLFPITKENKAEQEALELKLLQKHQIDFIVLARYMQILSENFVNHYPNKVINIHHSFLPAFPGARPYHCAYNRGVKVVGTTSHYVTADLDAGPIIAQDVVRVSHTDTVSDLIRKGRDLEKIVLARAIWHHIQRKILVFDNRTIIFS